MPSKGPDGRQLSGAANRKRHGYTRHRSPAEVEQRAERSRTKPSGSSGVRPWLFVDTEGAHDPDGRYGAPGRQWTMLVTASSGDGPMYEGSLYTGRPLETVELLAFICALPAGYKLGAYGFGYDVDQITHELDPDDLRRLHAGLRVHWRRFALRRRGARFTVGLLDFTGQLVDGSTRTIWDVVRLYRGRLPDVVQAWKVATSRELEFLGRMKDERGDFTLAYWRQNRRQLERYSLLENRLAARVQARFDEQARQLGYPLRNWNSAGSMAAAMMAAEGIRDHLRGRQPIPPALGELLPYSYYGGRFEIYGPGEYSPIYEYDLASAYPAALVELPCLAHSTWRFGTRSRTPDRWGLYRVRWSSPRGSRWGPFPLRRKDGTVYYPLTGESVVWGVELLAATRLGYRVEIAGGWKHACKCSCDPFGWVRGVYELRRQLGRDLAGEPLKLGLNSVYGKLASTVGVELTDGVPSGWFEPRWASMITSYTRARLLEALRAAGGPRDDRVIMFATDAVYATAPVDGLDLGDGLGQWTAHEYRTGLLVQPGIYFLRNGAHDRKLRRRGLTARELARAETRFLRAWRRHGDQGSVTIRTDPRYQSVRLAMLRGQSATLDKVAWRWSPETRRISLFPHGKREHSPAGAGAWVPAPNDETLRDPFDTAPVHYPHTKWAELFGVSLPDPPDVVPYDQLEADVIQNDQPRTDG